MTAWFEGIDVKVEIAFGFTPSDASPTWTDVSAFVRSWRTQRGTSDIRPPIQMAPGTATVTFRNDDRRFDPQYTTGPYFGNLVPNVPIRITATKTPDSAALFYGYVTGWDAAWSYNYGEATVNAVDGFRLLDNVPLLGRSAFEAEVHIDRPFAYWPLQSALEDRVADADLVDQSDGLLQYTDLGQPVSTSTACGAGIVSAGAGRDWPVGPTTTFPKALEWVSYIHPDAQNSSGVIHWSYHADYAGVASPSGFGVFVRMQGSWAGTLDPWQVEVEYLTENANTYVYGTSVPFAVHHWVVTVDSDTNDGFLKLYRDGVEVDSTSITDYPNTNSSSPSHVKLNPGLYVGDPTRAISHVAVYDYKPTPTRVLRHRLAFNGYRYPKDRPVDRIWRVLDYTGWPAGLRSIDDGRTRLGTFIPNGQSALAAIRDVERSDDGLFYIAGDGTATFVDRNTMRTSATVATFTDDGAAGDIAYYDLRVAGNHVDSVINTATVQSGQQANTSRDQTSIDAYGGLATSISTPPLTQAWARVGLGDSIVRENATPRPVVSGVRANMRVASGDNQFAKLAGLELGDRVSVEVTPAGVTPQETQSGIVVGIAHEFTVNHDWTVDVTVAPKTSATEAPYLIVGDPTYGRIGAAAGNKIPY